MEPLGIGPCQAAVVWSHVIVSVLSVFTTAFSGYLAFRVSEAKADRELKFRQMEFELAAAEKRIVEVTTERQRTNGR